MGLSVLDRLKKHDRKVPLLRGRIHVINFLLHLNYLRRIPQNAPKEIKMAHYVTLGISVVNTVITLCYHNSVLDNESRNVFKRVDYAVNFLTVSSAYFPMYIYLIRDDFSVFFVIVYWLYTLTGVFSSLIYDFCKAPKPLRVAGFVSVGLFNHFISHNYYASRDMATLFKVLFGSFLYLVGAVIYAAKFPNLVPRVFEHHELMHLLVVLGNFYTFEADLTVG